MPYAMAGGHGYFEIALDSALHAADTGRPWVPAEDSSPVPSPGERTELAVLLRAAIREVYDLDVSITCLEDSFLFLHRVRRLFPSRHGGRRALFYAVETLFGGRGFLTGHVSPRDLAPDLPEEWVDPATGRRRRGGVKALLHEAEQRTAGGGLPLLRPALLGGCPARAGYGQPARQPGLRYRHRDRAQRRSGSARLSHGQTGKSGHADRPGRA